MQTSFLLHKSKPEAVLQLCNAGTASFNGSIGPKPKAALSHIPGTDTRPGGPDYNLVLNPTPSLQLHVVYTS